MAEEPKIPLPRSLQEIVGSLLFASETPLTAGDLRAAVKAVEPEKGDDEQVMEVYKTCTSREIDAALKGLEKALEVAGCGFELVCTAGAYRLQTVPSCARYVRALLKLDRPSRLGRASLETLAIIAYRQPITKGEVEEIRGVDVSGNMKTLMDLQLIRLVGKSELPGHPFLYGTTPLFLEHFGLASLQQLNELDPTLQRSNPRLKAASYKKAVEEKPQDEAQEEAPPALQENEPQDEAETAEPQEIAEPPADETEETSQAQSGDDDDGFFIDDTPDEYDDEDEDDEDDEDEDLDDDDVEDDEDDDEDEEDDDEDGDLDDEEDEDGEEDKNDNDEKEEG